MPLSSSGGEKMSWIRIGGRPQEVQGVERSSRAKEIRNEWGGGGEAGLRKRLGFFSEDQF